MAKRKEITTGGCLCGAVRYEAEGIPIVVGHCHCETCRKHTGAPIVTFVAFESRNVRFTQGNPSHYQSSPNAKRAFCSNCGTPLTWEGDYAGYKIIEFHVSSTDEPDRYPPTFHWHHGERISWFDSADSLPRYRASSIDASPYQHSPADS